MEIEVKYRFQKEFFMKLKNHFIAAAEKSIASQVTKGTVNSALHGTTGIPAENGPNDIYNSSALNGSAAYNGTVAWSSAALNGSAGTSNLELIFKSKNVQSNYFFGTLPLKKKSYLFISVLNCMYVHVRPVCGLCTY